MLSVTGVDAGGLTLVVSPLISLMRIRYAVWMEHGVEAAYLSVDE